MAKLLFDKNGTITFNRDLACVVGLNEAIMLQQIHYWIEYNKTEYLRGNPTHENSYQAGRFWTKNKVEKWKEEHFPFWSTSTVRRIFESLEKDNLIIVDSFNEYKFDKTLWYTINYEKLEKLAKEIEDKIAKREQEKIKKEQEKKRKQLEREILRQQLQMAEAVGNTHLFNLSKSNNQEEQYECSDMVIEPVSMSNTITKTTTKTTTEITPKNICTTLSDELTMSSEGDGEEVVALIESETHLLLTANMKRKARKWNIKRTALAIKIFLEKQGERFALLEKVYADDRNFIPNYQTNPKKKVDNWNNFQQRDYDYEDLEAKLLGWK